MERVGLRLARGALEDEKFSWKERGNGACFAEDEGVKGGGAIAGGKMVCGSYVKEKLVSFCIVLSLLSVIWGNTAFAATISGYVRDTEGVGLYLSVGGVDLCTGDPCGSYEEVSFCPLNNPEGAYSFTNLPAGTYFLSAWGAKSWGGWGPEWYAGTESSPLCSQAQPIEITDGQVITERNFQLNKYLNGPILTATPASYNQINLDWSPISGAAIYALYRAESAAGPFAHRVYCGGDTSHEDKESTLAPSTTYYYKVMSGDATASCSSLATGWATPSDAVSATTLAAGPLAPLEISLSSSKGMPGSAVDIRGSGFTIGGICQIKKQRVGDSSTVSEDAAIDGYGKIKTAWDVSLNTVAGSYRIWAIDGATGRTSIAVTYEVSPANIIQTGSYSFANVDTESNYFAVWTDISVNGQKNTQICNEYFYRVTAESGMSVEPQGCLYLGDGTTSNSSRYRFRFKVGNVGRAAWFENGKITLERKADHATHDFSGLHGFSVYGTTFDIKKHAWKFKNTAWTEPAGGVLTVDNDFYHYMSVVQDLLPSDSQGKFADAFRDTRDGDWSRGACYGLTTSAVANFTHENESSWGTGQLYTTWKKEIQDYWPDNADRAAGPFKPLAESKLAYNEYDPLNQWTDSAAKKIMYYHATQDAYGQGKNGVGSVSGYTSDDPNAALASLLQFGSPVIFNFKVVKDLWFDGGHSIAMTQMILWNGQAVYSVWDNNFPYDRTQTEGYSPYLQWQVTDNAVHAVRGEGTKIYKIESDKGAEKKQYDIYDTSFVSTGSNNGIDNDPHNFYNDRQLLAMSKNKALVESKDVIPKQSDEIRHLPEHIKIIVVGAKVIEVKDKDSNALVQLIPNGEIETGKSVIETTMNGMFNSIYLQIDSNYRVDVSKLVNLDGFKIYVTFPLSDGQVETIHYNIPLSAADATQAYFFVGRGNGDKELHLVAGGAHAPSYENTFLPTISAPSNFRGLFEAGGVRLSWNQTQHPAFDHIQVVRKVGVFPESLTDGTVVYSGAAEGVVDATAASNYLYYYSAFSVDSSGNASPPAEFSIDTRKFSIEGILTQADGQPLAGGKIVLLDGDDMVQYETYSGRDGRYTLPNLENNPYSIKAEKFGNQFRNAPRNVDINIANKEENFVADSVPAIRLLFDLSQVYLGGSYDLRWAYANLPVGETVNVRLKRNGVWESIATGVPATNGVVSWKVNGAVSADATVEIVTASNQTVVDTIQLAIENGEIFQKAFPWTMFLPAITGKKR